MEEKEEYKTFKVNGKTLKYCLISESYDEYLLIHLYIKSEDLNYKRFYNNPLSIFLFALDSEEEKLEYNNSLSIEEFANERIKLKGYKDFNEFLRIRIYPFFNLLLYCYNNNHFPTDHDFEEERITTENFIGVLKSLEYGLNNSENRILSELEKEALKFMFKLLRCNKEHFSFKKRLTQVFLLEEDNYKCIKNKRRLAFLRIYIFLLLYPSDFSPYKIAGRNVFTMLVSISESRNLEKPLKLSNIEIKYILKEVFEVNISINTIKRYCNEMNLKTYNPKKGNKINREDIKHPYLEKDILEELRIIREKRQ